MIPKGKTSSLKSLPQKSRLPQRKKKKAAVKSIIRSKNNLMGAWTVRKTLTQGAVRQALFAGDWAPMVAASPEARVVGWQGKWSTWAP